MNIVEFQKSIAPKKKEVINDLCRFLSADTMLFWSDNPDLQSFQKKHWQPLLDKLNGVFKLNVKTTTGLYLEEDVALVHDFTKHLNNMSDKELTACFLAASKLKSVLLGLLLAKREISSDDALYASFLEEFYQNQKWGEDVAALNLRQSVKSDLDEIERYLQS